jgi:hypothetical protein
MFTWEEAMHKLGAVRILGADACVGKLCDAGDEQNIFENVKHNNSSQNALKNIVEHRSMNNEIVFLLPDV